VLLRKAHFLLAVPAICLAQAPAQSRLVLDATDHDFGKLAPGTAVTHRFKATNGGNAPLTINHLSPSCGCTSTVVGKSFLLPGESTELEVTFNPEGQSGLVHKSVRVESDAAVDPIQTLTFQAEVLPDILPSTTTVRFQDLLRADHRKASVRLSSGTAKGISLSDVDLSEAPWLGVATREEGRDLWVDFELLASRLPKDKLHGDDTVRLHVSNPNPSEVNLTVHWELRAPVLAVPGRIAWAGPAGQDRSMAVRLNSRNRKPFRILSARTSNPLIQVSAPSPKAAPSQAIQVRMLPSAPAGVYEDSVTLTLDTPGRPVFEFRVSAALN